MKQLGHLDEQLRVVPTCRSDEFGAKFRLVLQRLTDDRTHLVGPVNDFPSRNLEKRFYLPPEHFIAGASLRKESSAQRQLAIHCHVIEL